MEDKIKYYLEKLNLENFVPYLNSTFYLTVLAGLFFLCILLFLIFLFKTKKSDIPKRNTLKPNLEEIIDRKEIKINDDNEFVDVFRFGISFFFVLNKNIKNNNIHKKNSPAKTLV